MTDSDTSPQLKIWLRIAVICGILASICYTLSTMVPLPFRIDYNLFFAFGPLLMASVFAIYHYLKAECESIALQMATIFLIAAGIAFTMMATMQGSIRHSFREEMSAVEADEARAEIRTRFLGVDSTQLGLDMAFDIFISSGTFLLGLALIRHPRFGWWFAIPAMAVAATGLTLNTITFPENSGVAGYVDPGPFFSVVYGLIVLQLIRCWAGWNPPTTAQAQRT